MHKRSPLITTVNIYFIFISYLAAKVFNTRSNLGRCELPKTVPNLKTHGLQKLPEFLIIVFSHNAFNLA